MDAQTPEMRIIQFDGNTYRVLVDSIRPVRMNEYSCDAWKLYPDSKWHTVQHWDRLNQLAKMTLALSNLLQEAHKSVIDKSRCKAK